MRARRVADHSPAVHVSRPGTPEFGKRHRAIGEQIWRGQPADANPAAATSAPETMVERTTGFPRGIASDMEGGPSTARCRIGCRCHNTVFVSRSSQTRRYFVMGAQATAKPGTAKNYKARGWR